MRHFTLASLAFTALTLGMLAAPPSMAQTPAPAQAPANNTATHFKTFAMANCRAGRSSPKTCKACALWLAWDFFT